MHSAIASFVWLSKCDAGLSLADADDVTAFLAVAGRVAFDCPRGSDVDDLDGIRPASACAAAARHGLLPSDPQAIRSLIHAASRPSYFHLHLVSDATGETLITVARAAAAQYANVSPVEHIYPLVRTQKQLDRVLAEIEDAPGIVLYTLLEDDLVERLEKNCRELGLPCLSILGPVLQLFQSYLGAEIDARASARSTRSMPNISSASTRSTTPCCMTTASIPTISRRPMSCWSACRAPRRRRPRSISPTAA